MGRENAVVWAAPAGWSFRRKLHAAHECGWVHAHPDSDPAGHIAACEAHAAECPWPDMPPPTDTPDG